MKQLKYKEVRTCVGSLKIVSTDKTLVAILWDNEKPNRVKWNAVEEDAKDPLLLEVENQLTQYFSHKRKTFDVPLEIEGTDFQRGVWKWLTQIPYGATWTYRDIAVKMNKPQAVRAVGTAIGRNPISIIIPCHRVIASNGSLAGFAGGIARKKILLDLEEDMVLAIRAEEADKKWEEEGRKTISHEELWKRLSV